MKYPDNVQIDSSTYQASDKQIGADLVRFSHMAYERLLAAGTGGNLSARTSTDGHIIVTPSGVALRDLSVDQLVTVTIDGQVVHAPFDLKPSKESAWHLDLYRQWAKVNAVVHLHCPYCVGATIADINWPSITVTAQKYIRVSPIVPAADPGSQILRESIACLSHAIEYQPNLILLAKHGIVALGENVSDAFDIADLAEETAKTFHAMRSGHVEHE